MHDSLIQDASEQGVALLLFPAVYPISMAFSVALIPLTMLILPMHPYEWRIQDCPPEQEGVEGEPAEALVEEEAGE